MLSYLPPITGKIPEIIMFSALVIFSFPTNCVYLCTILVVPSLSALFVPTCTNIDSPWPCLNVFSTRSVTCSIKAPGRQTTTYSLVCLSQNGVAHKHPFCSQCPLNHYLTVAPPFYIYLVVDFPLSLFVVVPFFPACFLTVITSVIDFPFDTSTLTAFLPFIRSHCIAPSDLSPCHHSLFHPFLWSFPSPAPSQYRLT